MDTPPAAGQPAVAVLSMPAASGQPVIFPMLHDIVGDIVGLSDGPEDGDVVGSSDGNADGLDVGDEDGDIDGDTVTHVPPLSTE